MYMATEPSSMADIVPMSLLPDALGYGYFFDGLGAVLGPPIAGNIFADAFYLQGTSYTVAPEFIAHSEILHVFTRKRQKSCH